MTVTDGSADALTGKPIGKEAVVGALIDATITLIVAEGTHVSVRDIAIAAGVNHGLIHTYFGNKQALIAAALDEISARAAADTDARGFPPPDLANRRDGELAKAITRMRLDDEKDLFSSHPVAAAWKEALVRAQPHLDTETIDTMVITAATLGLGWAVFADHLCEVLDLTEKRRVRMDAHIAGLVAELGGIPSG